IVEGERGAWRRVRRGGVWAAPAPERKPVPLGVAAVYIGVCGVRIEFDGLLEVGAGAFVFPFCQPRTAAIVVRRCRGIELDGLVVIGDGAVNVALVAIRDAAVIEGGGIIDVGTERLVVIGERPVGVALIVVSVAAVVVVHRA